ncbi:PREDICTED: uncharacterized protein LOC109208265 [Nicotiana attenuata]|uniref:uncharacterized protein LOC109208265 n=1 Tax=Nicotiana attenuata TaxID=49451 RepID=UPI0009055E5F|nr:PREDICTED: uncharacterized protein LOC109208265 [Nicotiana attenuata]
MKKAHLGSCGAYQSGPKLHCHIKRMGYYWPIMVKDCMEHVKRCQVRHTKIIIIDNGTPFDNKLVRSLCEKFDFKQNKSSMYNTHANGLVEDFNKTFVKLSKKVSAKNKRNWHEKIGEALRVCRTTFRTATQETPYSFVYGIEVFLPLEQRTPSLHISQGLTSKDNAQLCQVELETLGEKR